MLAITLGSQPLAHLDLETPQLRIQNYPITRLRATASYRAGRIDYHLLGSFLDGRLVLEGHVPAGEARPLICPRASCAGRTAPVSLAAAAQPSLRGLGGTATLTLRLRQTQLAQLPVGSGRLEVRDLRWGPSEVTDAFRCEINLERDLLLLRDLDARLGEGRLQGRSSCIRRRNAAGTRWYWNVWRHRVCYPCC